MAYLSKDQILSSDDLGREVVAVPEWGGEILIRALSGAERDQYEESHIQYRALKGGKIAAEPASLINIRARLVSLSAIDESGARLFSDQDVAALGQKNAAALDRCFDVARRLSGLTEQDVKDLEEGF